MLVVAARRAFLVRCPLPARRAVQQTAPMAALAEAAADRPCSPPLTARRAAQVGLAVAAVAAVAVAAIRGLVAQAASAAMAIAS